jgi:hypothetical protein
MTFCGCSRTQILDIKYLALSADHNADYHMLRQPVQSYELDSSALACNRNFLDPTTPKVINVPSGAWIGMWWWGYVEGVLSLPQIHLGQA